MPPAVRVCFVCLGNICRSPTAEGVFRHLVAEAGLSSAFEIDSAGTAAYHNGEPPDHRARAAGKRAGISVSGQARQFVATDFARFDHVIAMDFANAKDLRRIAATDEASAKIRLLRSFDPAAPENAPVPDPYYGEDHGFDDVLELCRTACRHLLEEIRKDRRL
ncbi:MAG TPA: low molecular weight protein-tyrosine-phosphatase [Polyangiaceae bacterium]|jgi:protein-tyrosine phosphatase|nr:low molecular weight protein-tyrosine-phosphatase [Polyangiaceae bacterium]